RRAEKMTWQRQRKSVLTVQASFRAAASESISYLPCQLITGETLAQTIRCSESTSKTCSVICGFRLSNICQLPSLAAKLHKFMFRKTCIKRTFVEGVGI